MRCRNLRPYESYKFEIGLGSVRVRLAPKFTQANGPRHTTQSLLAFSPKVLAWKTRALKAAATIVANALACVAYMPTKC